MSLWLRRLQGTRECGSVHLRHLANHLVHIGFPSVHSHDGEDGVDSVVLLAVNGFDVKAIYFENAQDIAVFDHPLRDAISVVPHIVRLLVEREPVESSEVHVVFVTL